MKDSLWNTNSEIAFFEKLLDGFLGPDQLFYKLNNTYYAYIPEKKDSKGQTLQSRNSYIGNYTETWCEELLSNVARKMNLFAIRGAICDELALSQQSPADLVFSTKKSTSLEADEIKIIFEVKMSIVSNYKYTPIKGVSLVGDYKSHKGTPSLLRSDSMLKAIGKSLNIRVSSLRANTIPIIVLGNSPISDHYLDKVDTLKDAGIIQGFWSLYPKPTNSDYNSNSLKGGFITMNNLEEIDSYCQRLLKSNYTFFSSMLPRQKIGELIAIANQEPTNELKADKFLQLLREQNHE